MDKNKSYCNFAKESKITEEGEFKRLQGRFRGGQVTMDQSINNC